MEGADAWESIRRSDIDVAVNGRTHVLQMRHRSCTVEPTSSPLFRLMGAALWPSTMSFLQYFKDDEVLENYAKHGGSLLELGSGHAFCGLVSSFLPAWRNVVVTDKDVRLVELMAWNCKLNQKVLAAAGTLPQHISARQLVWGHEEGMQSLLAEFGGFEVVLTVGCTYSKQLLAPLMRTIAGMLRNKDATALILHECREDRPSIKGVNKIKRANQGAVHGFWRGSRRGDHPTVQDLADEAERWQLEVIATRRGQCVSASTGEGGEASSSRSLEPGAKSQHPHGQDRMDCEKLDPESDGGGGGRTASPEAQDCAATPADQNEDRAIGESVWGSGSAALLTLRLKE